MCSPFLGDLIVVLDLVYICVVTLFVKEWKVCVKRKLSIASFPCLPMVFLTFHTPMTHVTICLQDQTNMFPSCLMARVSPLNQLFRQQIGSFDSSFLGEADLCWHPSSLQHFHVHRKTKYCPNRGFQHHATGTYSSFKHLRLFLLLDRGR